MVITGKLCDFVSANLEKIYQRLLCLSIIEENCISLKRIKYWKNVSCYNSPSHNVNSLRQGLVIVQNHLMHNICSLLFGNGKKDQGSIGRQFNEQEFTGLTR